MFSAKLSSRASVWALADGGRALPGAEGAMSADCDAWRRARMRPSPVGLGVVSGLSAIEGRSQAGGRVNDARLSASMGLP